MKAFNDLADFTTEEVQALIELAGRLDASPEPEALKGKVLSLLFLSPSLRTLASFQAAMVRLGGGSFVISPDMSIHGLEVRDGIVMDGVAAEHIREAVPVIASYGDAIGNEVMQIRDALRAHWRVAREARRGETEQRRWIATRAAHVVNLTQGTHVTHDGTSQSRVPPERPLVSGHDLGHAAHPNRRPTRNVDRGRSQHRIQRHQRNSEGRRNREHDVGRRERTGG